MEERARAKGIVTIQESAMFLISTKSILARPALREPWSVQPLATPAPTTPITWQWVVEVGMPATLHTITTREADRTTVKPRDDVIFVIFVPIVTITRSP